jgi:hypothetical protein
MANDKSLVFIVVEEIVFSMILTGICHLNLNGFWTVGTSIHFWLKEGKKLNGFFQLLYMLHHLELLLLAQEMRNFSRWILCGWTLEGIIHLWCSRNWLALIDTCIHLVGKDLIIVGLHWTCSTHHLIYMVITMMSESRWQWGKVGVVLGILVRWILSRP